MAQGEMTVRIADAAPMREVLDAVSALLREMHEADDDRYDVQVQRVEAALAELIGAKSGGSAGRVGEGKASLTPRPLL